MFPVTAVTLDPAAAVTQPTITLHCSQTVSFSFYHHNYFLIA